MNATGKRLRKQTGLTRYELHRDSHAHKSPAKRARARWGKSGAPMTKNNR